MGISESRCVVVGAHCIHQSFTIGIVAGVFSSQKTCDGRLSDKKRQLFRRHPPEAISNEKMKIELINQRHFGGGDDCFVVSDFQQREDNDVFFCPIEVRCMSFMHLRSLQ
jgi:hypothetical protein